MFSRQTHSKGRIAELDGIRGLAILLVLFYHYVAVAIPQDASRPLLFLKRLFSNGWSGVDLFFVLSGFLIAGILIDQREAPNYFRAFYLRRLNRIFPLYYAFLILFVVLGAASKNWGFLSQELFVTEFSLTPYFFHLQNLLMGIRGSFGNEILAITWSLAIEEHFYLFLPLLIRRTSPIRLPLNLAVIALLSLALRLTVAQGTYISFVLTPWRLDGLLIGALLAVLFRRQSVLQQVTKRVSWVKAGVIVLAALFLVSSFVEPLGSLDHMFEFGLLFAGIIFLALTQTQGILARIFRSRLLGIVGRISYGIYLFHQLVNYSLHNLFFHHQPSFHDLMSASVTLAASLLTVSIAYVSFHTFERFFISVGHKNSYSSE